MNSGMRKIKLREKMNGMLFCGMTKKMTKILQEEEFDGKLKKLEDERKALTKQ